MPNEQRPLKVFLCHASQDKPKVRELYRTLRRRGIQPWLDAEDLIPGQNWEVEIPKALHFSDAIIICLSPNSVDKEGYVQKEIKFALDKALEMPEGRIFLIPAKLEECDLPFRLKQYQAVNLYEKEGYVRLMKALKLRASQLERKDVKLTKDVTITPEIKTIIEENKVDSNQENPETIPLEPVRESLVDHADIDEYPGSEISTIANTQEKPVAPSKPEDQELAPLNPNVIRKSWTVKRISLFGFAGIIIAGLLLFPLIDGWFPPNPSPTVSITNTLAGTPEIKTTPTVFNPQPDSSDVIDEFGIPMRLIPSNNATASFYIDKYEVTNVEYKLCKVCEHPVNQDAYNDQELANHPIAYVSWDMAKNFCEWRSARLPTKDEWELAAYGVDDRQFPWGNEFGCDKANYSDCTPGTTPVGSYEEGASPYKVYDIAGNVWEWIDAGFNKLTGYHLVLGGSYNSTINDMSAEKGVSNNEINSAAVRDVGFRCTRDAAP